MNDGEAAARMPPGAVTLGEVTLARVWNLRGEATQGAFVSEASRLLALPLPLDPLSSAARAEAVVLWLGPRAWLYVDGEASAAGEFETARRAINAAGGALFDVSASYVAWRVTGECAARVLNRGCPLDLRPAAFPPGRCAQSVLGHVNALFYRPDEGAAFIVMVARSFASDAWQMMCAAATTEGYRVAEPAAFVARS